MCAMELAICRLCPDWQLVVNMASAGRNNTASQKTEASVTTGNTAPKWFFFHGSAPAVNRTGNGLIADQATGTCPSGNSVNQPMSG